VSTRGEDLLRQGLDACFATSGGNRQTPGSIFDFLRIAYLPEIEHAPPTGDLPDALNVNGHLFVHVAACRCERIQREVARLAPHAPDRTIGYTAFECEREMVKLGGHCANPDEHI
jgi:hypothetical protein